MLGPPAVKQLHVRTGIDAADTSIQIKIQSGTIKEIVQGGVATLLLFSKAECVHARKGRAPPRASNSSKIAMAGLRRLLSALAAAPVLFTHAIVTEIKINK